MIQARVPESVPLLLEALSGFKGTLGERHATTLSVSNDLAVAYEQLGRRAEAEEIDLGTVRALSEGRTSAQDAVFAGAAFHLACLNAVRGERSKAMEWLKASVEAGLADPDRISRTAELASLHGPDFDRLVERARRN
jgi:Flp pilus assembly protein TadD